MMIQQVPDQFLTKNLETKNSTNFKVEAGLFSVSFLTLEVTNAPKNIVRDFDIFSKQSIRLGVC